MTRQQTLAVLSAALAFMVMVLAIQHLMLRPTLPEGGEPGYERPGLPLIREQGASVRQRLEGERVADYVSRMTRLVYGATWHCLPDETLLSWLERLVGGRDYRSLFDETGMLVERRFSCGYCHQRAYLLKRILAAQGLESRVFALNGHVVVHLEVDGRPSFADPDFGVGPFPISADPAVMSSTVRSVYARSPGRNGLDNLAVIFAGHAQGRTYPGLDALHTQQAKWLKTFDLAALGLLTCSAVLLLLSFRLFFRSRSS